MVRRTCLLKRAAAAAGSQRLLHGLTRFVPHMTPPGFGEQPVDGTNPSLDVFWRPVRADWAPGGQQQPLR